MFSVPLISPALRGHARLSTSQSPDEVTTRGPRTAPRVIPAVVVGPASRCRRSNKAALIKRPWALLRICLLLVRRGIYERPTTLDRQRRTPTKDRIQNTPGKGKAIGRGPIKEQDRPPCALPRQTQAVRSRCSNCDASSTTMPPAPASPVVPSARPRWFLLSLTSPRVTLRPTPVVPYAPDRFPPARALARPR